MSTKVDLAKKKRNKRELMAKHTDSQNAQDFLRGSETHQQRENTHAADGKLLDLPLGKLHTNPLNARTYYDEETIEQRAASLEKDGQLVPIIVVPHPSTPGSYVIVDGHFRYKAAQFNGWSNIRAELLPETLDDFELYKVSCDANEERKSQMILDTAAAWKKLVNKGVATREMLGNFAKKSSGEVSKIMKIAEIPHNARSVLARKETPLGVNEGYEVYQVFKLLGDTPEFLDQVKRITEKNLGRSHIEKIRKELTPKSQNQPLPAPLHQFTDAQGKVTGKLDRKGKKISLSYQAASEEQAERISQVIAELMKKEGK